jgi:hypothetical protein
MEIPFHVNEFIVYPMNTPKKEEDTAEMRFFPI